MSKAEKIGEIIKKMRKLRGMSVKELAGILKCSKEIIRLWEHGKRKPNKQHTLELYRLLGATPGEGTINKEMGRICSAGLPVWFDKYSIHIGDSIVNKVQEGLEEAESIIFWITSNFLESKWCKYEMSAFIKKLIEEDALIISILDKDISISQLPLFLQDIKVLYNNGQGYEVLSREIITTIKDKDEL